MFTKLKKRSTLKTALLLSILGSFLFWLTPIAYSQNNFYIFNINPENQINADWLIFKPKQNQFTLYIPEYHGKTNALYQWVTVKKDKPFKISFTAKKDLCVFINNKLIFSADSVAPYNLDLSQEINFTSRENKYLLCIWHPTDQPDYTTFKNELTSANTPLAIQQTTNSFNNLRPNINYNAFIIFLLLIGLIYGSLRTNYYSDFKSLFNLDNLMRRSALEEGFLAKPISSWSSILFIVAFSISFALLIVAIHTNIQNIVIFNRLFAVSETDITSKILFYAFIVFSFILVKYLFLRLMGYIFDLTSLVSLQFREFIRTLLFMGIFLPVIMLLYLALNTSNSQLILYISNIVVSSILIITELRIFYTLNKKASLLNLHLFSYICATEIIPLIVLLKLIVFTY